MSAWPVEPSVTVPTVVTAVVYLRGWHLLRRRLPQRFSARQAMAFVSGLAILMSALASPLDGLAHRWLAAHMVQHLLLMVVVAPLFWMGAPEVPFLVGLPRSIRRLVLRALRAPGMRHLQGGLVHPAVGWTAFAISFWVWHVPGLYDLALDSHLWHHVEHACFLVSALLFWRPVILAWPARTTWPRWAMIPYLVIADLQNSVLAAILTFSDRVIYAAYATPPGTWDGSALDDQAIAGVIMWVPGSVAFLLPAIWLIVTTLSAARPEMARPAAGQLER